MATMCMRRLRCQQASSWSSQTGFSLPKLMTSSCAGGNAHLDQVVLRGAGAPVAQCNVVLGGAPLIAVALDGQLIVRVILQDVAQLRGIGLQGLHSVGTQRGLVVVEIGVFDFGQKLIDAGARGGIRISLLRRGSSGRLRGRGTHWRRSGFRSCGRDGGRGRRRRRRGSRYLLFGTSRAEQSDGSNGDQSTFGSVNHRVPLTLD